MSLELQAFIQNSPWKSELSESDGSGVYTGTNLEPAQIIEKIKSEFETKNSSGLLQRTSSEWVRSEWNDLVCLLRILQNPKLFLDKKAEILGAGEILSIISHSSTSAKSDVKAALEEKFSQLGSQHLNESLEAIFEELFMNAIFDAPSEAKKLGVAKTEEKYKINFIFAYNQERVFLGCSDPFGSLNLKKAIHRMNEVYTKGAGAALNRGEGGAGLGCTILLEHSLSLVMICQKFKQTFVGCLLPRGMSYRQRSRMKKSIVCFELERD